MIGLCANDFHGDVAAQASAATGWRDRFHIKPDELLKERPGLIDTQIT